MEGEPKPIPEPTGKTAKERYAEKIKPLDAWVSFFRSLSNKLYELNADISHEEVAQNLHDFLQAQLDENKEIFHQKDVFELSEEDLEAKKALEEQIIEIERQIGEAIKEKNEFVNNADYIEAAQVRDTKIVPLTKTRDELGLKLQEYIDTEPEQPEIVKFREFVRRAIERNRIVKKMQEESEKEGVTYWTKFLPKDSKETGINETDESVSTESNIVEVIPDAFCMTLILRDDYYNRVFNSGERESKSAGFSKRYINFIQEKSRSQHTYEHEKVHSLHSIMPFTALHTITIQGQVETDPKVFLDYQPHYLFNQVHQEIVAALDAASDSDFNKGKIKIEPDVTLGRDSRLNEYINVLSTAGGQFFRMLRDVGNVSVTNQNPFVRKHAAELRVSTPQLLLNSVDALSAADRFLKKYHPDDHDILWILATILKPSKYRRIGTYFEAKYGEEWQNYIAEAQAHKENLTESILPYGPTLIRNFKEKVESGKTEFTEQLKEAFKKTFETRKDSVYSSALELNSWSEFQNYLADMTWLTQEIFADDSKRDEHIEFVKKHINRGFFDSIFIQPKIVTDTDEAIHNFLIEALNIMSDEDKVRLSDYLKEMDEGILKQALKTRDLSQTKTMGLMKENQIYSLDKNSES